jgi:glutathionyl-hydroquinone reductase
VDNVRVLWTIFGFFVQCMYYLWVNVKYKFYIRQRYICGNTLSETDIRLFVTLIRFDEVLIFIF